MPLSRFLMTLLLEPESDAELDFELATSPAPAPVACGRHNGPS